MARRMTVPQRGTAGEQNLGNPATRSGAGMPDTGTLPTDDTQATGAPPEGTSRRPRGSLRRAGAGGRWWVWAGRAVLWAFIIVIAVNGGRAAFVSFTQQPVPAAPETDGGSGYPVRAAAAYAQQFADLYLNYDEASAGTRARRLASYLPDGADSQLGWNGAGRLRLGASHLAGVDVRDDTHAVVNLAVLVDDTWMRLAVPVYASGGAMVIAGQPALLPAPPKATPPALSAAEIDTRATNELNRQLPGFFKAYAMSDSADLERYLDQGVSVTGLSGAVRFVSLQDVIVPPGGEIRKITATVVWRIPTVEKTPLRGQRTADAPAAELVQTYELTVTKQNGNWYVKDIKGAAIQSGQ